MPNDSLRVRLLGGEKERLVKRRTRNQEAHSLFLKGRYFWNRRYEGPVGGPVARGRAVTDRQGAYR